MSKILVNKNFNKKYLYRYAQGMIRPTNTSTTAYIKDITTATAASEVLSAFKYVSIVNNTMLNVLEKISKSYNDTTIVTTSAENTYLGKVMGGFFHTTFGNKSAILSKFVTDGVITQEEVDKCVMIRTETPTFNTVTDDNGIMTMTSTLPIKLELRYENDVMNSDNEQLYILFPTLSSHQFNAMTGTSEANFFSTSSEVTKQAFPYVAVSFGTENTNDVVLDYIGKIDYLDDFDIKIQLPK